MQSQSFADQLKDFLTDKENTTPLTDKEFAEWNRFKNTDHRLGDLEIAIAEEINLDALKKV